MNGYLSHDAARAAFELREQLASDKRRLAFFMGAGTSMAVGVPGINELTSKVEEKLPEPMKKVYGPIRSDLGEGANVEDVLDRVRLFRELLGDCEDRKHNGFTGKAAKELDASICAAIRDIVCVEPAKGILPHRTFAQWLYASYSGRGWPVEIFTTNYDLLFERAMEGVGVPFFDGFIGSVAPFFAPEPVDTDSRIQEGVYPPRSWTRLWKMHGSVNWHLLKEEPERKSHVSRLSGPVPAQGEQLMIFPSREKYADSRRLPFLTYQDRLRRFLSSGESVLFVLGYGFSDEHLNEIIFQGLRGNNRLAVNALMYGVPEKENATEMLKLPERLVEYGRTYRNMSVYGPEMAVIGGVEGKWSAPPKKKGEYDALSYWSDKEVRFILGDFHAFASYLERFIGFGGEGRIAPANSAGPTEVGCEK